MAKILLVEDDKSLREIYGVRLLAEGYDIVSAGDGEEALAMAIKERPQLIVSDVMMPKISGFDMLDILRSTSETKDIKVIMMTALSSEDQRQRGEQLGADRYLVKSQVGIEDVVRTVHEVLADMPAPGTQQNPFGSAVPRSAPTAAPQPAAQPVPAAAVTQPAATPTAVPVSGLPQPTAPFSTARPAGLADRIIQPIERPETSGEPLTSLIDKELNQAAVTPVPTAPPVPPAPSIAPVVPSVPPTPEPSPDPAQAAAAPAPVAVPAPQPAPVAPQPQPIQQPVQQLPTQPPVPAANPQVPVGDPDVDFEETPRQ